MLLLVDPETDPGLKDLLGSSGIAFNNDLVLDPALNAGSPAFPGVTNLPTHEVTRNLSRFGGIFFPGARSLKQIEGTDKSPEALFKTTDQACGKTDFEALKTQQQLQCDPSKDEKGPFTLGYAVEINPTGESSKPSRLVAIGNSSFATNQIFQRAANSGNRLLFRNAINWLAGQEQLIAIPPKEPSTHPLTTMSNTDLSFLLWSNVALIPIITLIIGGLIWWRRR